MRQRQESHYSLDFCQMALAKAHRVTALCLDGVVAFDLSVPAEVFSVAHDQRGRPLYAFEACAVAPGAVTTTTGFDVGARRGLEALAEADSVVVPGYASVFEPPPAIALEALRVAHARGARLFSVCTGAFALAHAGLLDGCAATTHWSFAGVLAERFPAVRVDPTALYVDEGEILTSAGLSAGIDLCLHVVRRDFGVAAGDRAARAMVAAPHREGGQAQFIRRPPDSGVGTLEQTRRWAIDRIGKPLDVAAMAGHAGVSSRTFARRFREETGTTPLQWLLGRRVLEARRMLEESALSVEDVAGEAGFGSSASLREHFRRALATTPTAYRRAFRS